MNEQDPYSIEALYGLSPEPQAENSAVFIAEAPEAPGALPHAAYLRRLNLKPTSEEAATLSACNVDQANALCAEDEVTAAEIERNKVSPILAAICTRAAAEALLLSRTQPGEEAYFEAVSDWLSDAAEFGFASEAERETFKKLLA